MTLKLNISDPETGRTTQEELDNDDPVLGKSIGDTVDGDAIGYAGYTFKITGGSDKAGFPMRRDVSGTGRKKILTRPGVGFKSDRDGVKVRKTVAGNTVYEDTVQVNMRIEEHGDEPIDELHPEDEAGPDEQTSEETTAESDEDSDQTPEDQESDDTKDSTDQGSDSDDTEHDKSEDAEPDSGTEDTGSDEEFDESDEEPGSEEDDEAEHEDTADDEDAEDDDADAEPEDVPDDSWTVPEIKDWLDEHDIEYTSDDLKADLLEKAAD